MSKLFIIPILVSFLIGCAGFQLTDQGTHQIGAYAAGRAMGLAVNKLSTELDKALTAKWNAFMEQNKDAMVPGPAVIQLFNDCGMQAALYVTDSQWIIRDLQAVLSAYGPQYDTEGNLETINPIPRILFTQFANGYATSRMEFGAEGG